MAGALEGIKVLDLSRFIAGPLCGMVLADLGADVVKVERAGKGEDSRGIPPFAGGESLYAMAFNRNKRGLTIDFRDAEGQALLRDLMARADIVIENFRPGTMEAMGCGYDVYAALNPRGIMVRISGYGQEGPYAKQPCLDVIAQAISGLMEMTGTPEGPPLPSGTFLVDQVTGLYGAIAALGALQARERTGKGELIDLALFDSATTLLLTAIPERLLLGREAGRSGARDRYSAPANNYRCKDGRWVHFNAGSDIMFRRFATVVGQPELLADERFSSHGARMANAAAIEAIVAAWTAGHDSDEVLRRVSAGEIPCGKVATIDEVIHHPQIVFREQIVGLDHPTIGAFPMAAFPPRFTQNRPSAPAVAPSVGQHSSEVVADWLGGVPS